MDLGLVGRTAIVTGASRGIGRACADVLLAEGAQICAVGRDPELLATVGGGRGQVLPVSADLSTEAGCQASVAACLDRFGAVDILVNCAGSAQQGPVLDLTRSTIDDGLALKFHGYMRMAQLVAPSMVSAGWGRIINIAGGAGTSPTATNLPTSIANIAVMNLTRGLSDELSRSGILVNVICPGLTRTDRARNLKLAESQATGRGVDELLDEHAATTPARRIAEPEEVARVVAFLASEACSYVHASAIYMDGGSRRSTP